MPALASPSLWRTHPHQIKGYLYVWNPATVFACSVNQASFTYPLAQVTYDNVTSGTFGDVQVGQTVKITSSGGTFKGWARVRLAPTSSILYLGALSQGEMDFDDDDLITVLDDFRGWAKIPRIDAANPLAVVFYKDYNLAYTNQNTQPNPKINAGPPYVGFVDDDTGVITVVFALGSYPLAQGATIGASPYSGSIEDGTITSGTIASGTFTATFPAGKRVLSFSVVDSNSKTHTMHVPVAACERTGANSPLQVRLTSLRHAPEGTEAGFGILADDATTTIIPDGTLVLYFEEEAYGATPGSLAGYAGREHVKFWGWVVGAQSRIEPLTSDYEITARGPAGILATMPFFSASVDNKASPTHWFQFANLTLFRFIWYLLYWHTTVLDICDLERPEWYASFPYSRFDVDAGDIYSQIDTVAQYVTARLSCDHQGRFYLRRNPQLMSDADRDALTTIVTLADTDWTSINIEERQRPQLRWLRASGLLASTSVITPYLSIAPGKSPAQGMVEDVLERQLVTGQNDLNIRAGHVYAGKTSPYPRLEAGILHGGTVAHPAWREWVKLTMVAATNKRGLSYSSTRFVLNEVSANYDFEQGTTEEQWIMEQETSGVPGVTEPVPVSRMDDYGYTGLPPYTPITFDDYEPEPLPVTDFANSPALYALFATSGSYQYLCRTRNATDATPNWEIVFDATDATLFTSGLDFTIFRLDPWNPKQAAYLIAQDTSFIARLYYVENLDGPVGTQVLTLLWQSDTGISGIDMSASINVEGMVWIALNIGETTLYAIRRTSRNGSFGSVTVETVGSALQRVTVAPAYHGASSSVHDVYFTRNLSSGGGKVWKSTDGGATWGALYTDATQKVRHANVPYEDNANDEIVYWYGFGTPAADAVVRRNADTSLSNIAPQYSAVYYAGKDTSDALHIYTADRDRVSFIGINGADMRLFLSTDAGDSWTETNTPNAEHGNVIGSLYGWPYDYNTMVLVIHSGGNRGLWRTSNFYSGSPSSVTWANMLGDVESVLGGTVFAINLVVPVWVA